VSNKKRFKKEDRICLKLVFVVKKSRNEMDVDNMAKITLDGLKGVLYSSQSGFPDFAG
jgi:Holliday junction resolvase RusA-like endonuclease